MTPESLIRRRRPLSLEDIRGFNGDTLGGQLDGDINAPRVNLQQAALSQEPRRVALPSSSIPNNEQPPDIPVKDPILRGPGLDTVGAPPTMIQRNNKGRPVAIVGGNDPVANNQELIRAQEGYKAPRSTKDQILALLTGGVGGAIDYATNQNTRNRWAVGEDIDREQGQIDRELGTRGKQAAVAAAKMRPVYQQSQIDARESQQDEREINNALSQYNKLESYDPDSPSYSSLRDYFKARGLNPPKKVKGSNVVAEWRNGGLVLTDKTTGETRAATEGQTPVTDIGRTPNAQGLTPNQQAGITSREGEGQKNREASMARTKLLVNAVASRQQKQIDAEIAKMGDPQEMYTAASELWSQAGEKEAQANRMAIATEADVATKKQLLDDAAKLKEATVRIQQEARKAGSARGKSSNRPPSTTHDFSVRAYIQRNKGATEADARAFAASNYPNYQVVP